MLTTYRYFEDHLKEPYRSGFRLMWNLSVLTNRSTLYIRARRISFTGFVTNHYRVPLDPFRQINRFCI